MLIDWFTVVAQALNFLILVWLMKRFLYRPILAAIAAREHRIAGELADADAKTAEAQKQHDDFQHKNDEFDQQRAALFSKATTDAGIEGQRLLADARHEADTLLVARQDALLADASNLDHAVTRCAQEEVFAIARRALADLASSSLEERLSAVFTLRLRTMDGNAKIRLGAALTSGSQPALVQTAFDLPADQRAVIQNAVNETFAADVHLRFETAPDLVSGIALTAQGERVGWNIDEYLAALQRGVHVLLTADASARL